MEKHNLKEFVNEGGLNTIERGSPDDLFVVCASLEQRTTSVVSSLSSDYRSRFGLIYINKELLEGIEKKLVSKNLKKLRTELESHCENVFEIIGSQYSSVTQLLQLRNGLTENLLEETKFTSITIDTTTFNREALITIVTLIRSFFPDTSIRAIYVSAMDYGDWLSKGFRTMRNIIGFAGIQMPGNPTLLLILSGFEPERTLNIIEEHSPAIVLYGIADPPTEPKYLERNIAESEIILNRQDVQKFSFPSNNIDACKEIIEKEIEPYYGKYNIVIAPMNTKLSTISTLLVAMDHPEIQLTYAIPEKYNVKNYSIGANSIIIDAIPKAAS